MDNRWPNLKAVSDVPTMHPVDRARLSDACKRIHARTDFSALYNAATGCLHFYLDTPDVGAAVPSPLSRVMRKPGFPWPIDDNRLEDIVRFLQMGRMSRHQKDEQMRYSEKSRASDAASANDRQRGEVERATKERLRRTLNRRGMSSKFTPSAVVNGLKGVR